MIQHKTVLTTIHLVLKTIIIAQMLSTRGEGNIIIKLETVTTAAADSKHDRNQIRRMTRKPSPEVEPTHLAAFRRS